MRQSDPIKNFVRRYLTRSVVGVSVGLAGLAPAAAHPTTDQQPDNAAGDQTSARSFADRLMRLRSAASALGSEELSTGELQLHLAQGTNFTSFANYQQDAWQDSTTVASKSQK